MFVGLSLAFFFHAMGPGSWTPALTNALTARGMGEWVPLVFLMIPVAALISPVLVGGLADHNVAAEKLFGWCSLVCAVALGCAFRCLELGWSEWWFVGWFMVASLVSAPTWGLLTTISLANLEDAEREFPRVRVAGTVGWMAGGWLVSYVLHADAGVGAGYTAAACRLIAAGMAFRLLPKTPPPGTGRSWKNRLGLGAFGLMKQRDHAVFFGVTAAFSVPLAAFYMYGPEFLMVLGDERPAGTMTIAQLVEVGCMLVVGAAMTRYRVKVVLMWAIGLGVMRFVFSAWAGVTWWCGWHVLGIALHGVVYTFYFITAQVFLNRRVDKGLRAQAQGLLTVVSAGVGPLIGTLVCGWLRRVLVTPDGEGWALFWAALAGMSALCFVVFALTYKGAPVSGGRK
nr:MFS transporter [Verrucomicrobiota bacterium JB025]